MLLIFPCYFIPTYKLHLTTEHRPPIEMTWAIVPARGQCGL